MCIVGKGKQQKNPLGFSFQAALIRLSVSKNFKMRLLSVVKGALQKFKKTEEPSDEIPEDFHQTPPGEFPKNGPKSSIVALVMFYLSKIVTLVGFIMVGRAVFFEEVKNVSILRIFAFQSFKKMF